MTLVYITNFGYLFGLVIINASAIQLRRKGVFRSASFKIPTLPIAIIAVASSILVLLFLELNALLLGLVFILAGALVTLSYRRAVHKGR